MKKVTAICKTAVTVFILVLLFAGCPSSLQTEVALTSILIIQKPDKLDYYTTDTFDPSGLVVMAVYSDVTITEVTDYTTDGQIALLTTGKRTVTVSYTENKITKTATFNVIVRSPDNPPIENPPSDTPPSSEGLSSVVLTSIAVVTFPAKLSYYVDETFSSAGLTVSASYSDGSTKLVNDWTTNGTEVINATGIDKPVTISYSEEGVTKMATFFIQVLYKFHDSVIELPFGTTGTNGVDSIYVYYGDWPQTIKDDTVVVDETKFMQFGGNTYYLGNDGNYYVKCLENAFDTDSQYRYSNGVQVGRRLSNNYAWFKVEPIKWRVLDASYNATGNMLLLAESILMADVPYGNSYYRDSEMRRYLNGLYSYIGNTNSWRNVGFLQSAFTGDAQNLIIATTVDNSAESTTDIGNHITPAKDCVDTQDKVFLLSEYEVTKYSKESFNSYERGYSRIRQPTDYALANYCYQSSSSVSGGCWWLRSAYYYGNDSVRYVNDYGTCDCAARIDRAMYGIVPALVVAL